MFLCEMFQRCRWKKKKQVVDVEFLVRRVTKRWAEVHSALIQPSVVDWAQTTKLA